MAHLDDDDDEIIIDDDRINDQIIQLQPGDTTPGTSNTLLKLGIRELIDK